MTQNSNGTDAPKLFDLITLASRFTKNQHEAEDLAQAAIEKGLLNFPGEKAPLGWYFVVIKNLFLRERESQHRRNQRERSLAKDNYVLEPPDAIVGGEELRRLLFDKLSLLPPGERRALDLYYLQELSLNQTAIQLGLAPRGAEARIRRAIKSLRQVYRRDSSFGGIKP